MVHLNLRQQEDEIRDLEYYLKSTGDLEIVEVQAQQIKRLIYFAKLGIKVKRRQGFSEEEIGENVDGTKR